LTISDTEAETLMLPKTNLRLQKLH